jgi:hypothetical protein
MLRQADQAHTDFAAITDDLEIIMALLAKVPTRSDLAWVALAAFAGGQDSRRGRAAAIRRRR